jgi:hypothetical protein
MGPTLVIVAVGVAFVLLGRWLYRNPTKLMPSWGFFNPENPSVQKVAQAYSVFLIFFGTLALSSVIIARLLPWATVILGLPIAILAAWFLRPRLDPPALDGARPVVADPVQTLEKQPLLGKHWKRGLAIAGGFVVVLGIFVTVLLADSDASKMAFAAAQADPTVRQRLGEPIKRGFFTSGSIEISGPSGHADIAVPIGGPRGKGTVYAVARKSANVWTLDLLEVAFSDQTERLDLLKHD